MKSLFAAILFVFCLPLAGQTEFEELDFEAESIKTPYRPVGKNYAFIRSKRGKSGVNRNNTADSILSLTINKIVLVFTELNKGDADEREEANRERWENLMRTYPEYFDYNSPTYVNVCQCNSNGDTEMFKQVQGFYIYFEGDEPEPEVAAPVKPEPVTVSKLEEKKEKPVVKEKEETVVMDDPEPEKVAEPVKESKPVKESRKKKEKEEDDNMDVFPEPARAAVVKKTGYSKPRRAKDPKACRPACYENGDEDLNYFFKENIKLSKKQRRKSKQLVAAVKLQLNFDGSIKKAMVTGPNTAFNQQVEEALKNMNLWNPTVKNGITVKSEVRMNLKYDRDTQSMKPADIMVAPRLSPKCKCVSDEEIFGNAN
jgi:hypothetical protein